MAWVAATCEGAIFGRLLPSKGADLSGSSGHELCLQCLLVLQCYFAGLHVRFGHKIAAVSLFGVLG
jgi:hypothetical protein